jgi:hypothetical protein
VKLENKDLAAALRFRKATNGVYIYGTDGAWEALREVQLALNGMFDDRARGEPTFDPKDFDRYLGGYRTFQQVMCHDLSATPGARRDKPPKGPLD